jgi:transformation/transcription domain-associated protein
LILTFKPETSFLVPLDRCIQLMKTILAAPPVPNLKGAEALVEHRRQALSFLRTCLASVLNLSSGTARAGAGEGDIKDALEGVVAGWFGKAETEGEEGGEGQSPTGGAPPGGGGTAGEQDQDSADGGAGGVQAAAHHRGGGGGGAVRSAPPLLASLYT